MAGANKIRALLAARQDKDRGDDVKAFRSRPSLRRGSKPDHGGGRRGRTTRARGSQRGLRLSRMEALDPQKKKKCFAERLARSESDIIGVQFWSAAGMLKRRTTTDVARRRCPAAGVVRTVVARSKSPLHIYEIANAKLR